MLVGREEWWKRREKDSGGGKCGCKYVVSPYLRVVQREGRGWRTRLGRMVQCVEKRRV